MIFDKTKRISIELSNLCVYSGIHKKCPLNLEREKRILPLYLLRGIISTCEKYSYKGLVAFHTYNEPLIDPRLFYLMEQYSKIGAKPIICTNGYYLNEELIKELSDFGVVRIHVSCYTDKDFEYFNRVKCPEKTLLVVQRGTFDNRLYPPPKPDDFLEKPNTYPLKAKCFAPLQEIIVRSDGKIGLCCNEWKREVSFGNLYEETLEDVLMGDKIKEMYNSLSNGDRYLWICHNCKAGR